MVHISELGLKLSHMVDALTSTAVIVDLPGPGARHTFIAPVESNSQGDQSHPVALPEDPHEELA